MTRTSQPTVLETVTLPIELLTYLTYFCGENTVGVRQHPLTKN